MYIVNNVKAHIKWQEYSRCLTTERLHMQMNILEYTSVDVARLLAEEGGSALDAA